MGTRETFIKWLREKKNLTPQQFLRLRDSQQLRVSEEFRKWWLNPQK